MTTTFRQSNVNFAPNVTPTSIDPDNVQANPQNENVANYNFNSRSFARSTSRRTATSSARSTCGRRCGRRAPATLVPEGRRSSSATSRRAATRNENTYTTPRTLKMTSFLETGFDLPPYLDGRYDLTPYISQSAGRGIPTPASGDDHAQPRARRRGVRRHRADDRPRYAMAEIYAGPKLFLLPGIRYEYTSDDFVGRNVRFAPERRLARDRSDRRDGELRRRRCRPAPALRRDAGHQPARRRDAVAGAAELLRRRAVPRAGRQRQRRSRSATRICSRPSRGTST